MTRRVASPNRAESERAAFRALANFVAAHEDLRPGRRVSLQKAGGARSLIPFRSRSDEAYVPTERPAAQAQAWVSRPDAHARRKGDHRTSSFEGPPPPRGVTPSYVTLRKRADFDRVLRKGQRSRSGELSVVTCPGPEPRARLGFVIPRRLGNAVDRNRVKRRLREAANVVDWEPGSDYVVIGSSQVKEAPFEVLVAWLSRAIE